MGGSSSEPNPDLVYGLYSDGFKPQLVRTALLLDVFSPLSKGPADAREVASACGCDVSGIGALLDYLSDLQLLDRRGSAYALTPTAATFLIPGEPTYAGDWVLMETGPEMWRGILDALRTGRPSHPAIPWAQDAWLESYRSARLAKSLEMWRAAGIEAGQCPRLRVLDLACGCAVKSLVLAQADPTVQVTCVDSAEVLQVTRDLAERLQVAPQVTLLPGDLHTTDLGEERYDAALLGQITCYFTPEQNVALFRRIHRALSGSGILVLDTVMASEEHDEATSRVTVLLWALSGGAAYPFVDYRNWLQEAGFSLVRQLSDRWLRAAAVQSAGV